LISLVVVNYNSGAFLKECAQSALTQVDELIVVDNASADDSIEMLLDACPNEPKLRVVRNAGNFGFAVACNIGGKLASGDSVLFLNPDCRLDSGAVAAMASVLESDASIGMVGGLLVNPDGTEQGGGRRAMPTPWRSFVRAFGLSRFDRRWPRLFFDFHLHTQPLPASPVEVEAISGACMLVKRAAMEDVGPWDEDYFLHCEDLDWCMRFRQKGWKVMFVPSARVTHALGVCGRSRPVFVEWHKHKGMMRFYRKFFRHQYPGVLMSLVMVGVWLRFGLVASYYTAMRAMRALRLKRG
jgi:GT2 family glycosyltransferase